jgi:hypothetical protein
MNNNIKNNALVLPNHQASRFNSFRNDLAFDSFKRPKYKQKNYILIASLAFQFIALLFTIIVYIFPLWISINIQTQPNQSINITEIKNSIQLTVSNSNQIEFSMGIWEIKSNQYSQLKNLLTDITVTSTSSMLWLDATYSSLAQSSYVYYFLSFIELASSSIFLIQILEVLHLIFMFLGFTTTSLVFCLCSRRLISPCWHLISFILNSIGFITGLSVIILIIVWQTSIANPIFNSLIQYNKNFGWCFYVSIGINCCLFIASLLILVFIIVDSMFLYEERKKTLNNLKLEMQRDIVRSIPVDYNKMPRLQKNMLINQVCNNVKTLSPFDLITGVKLMPFSNENPSYLLNFGNGNYYKRNVQMIENNDNIDDNYFHKKNNIIDKKE